MIGDIFQRAKTAHLIPLALIHLNAHSDLLHVQNVHAAALQDFIQPAAAESFPLLRVALVVPCEPFLAFFLPVALEIGVLEVVFSMQRIIKGLDGVEIPG